jgi:flagellar biogenesis protein FliO
MNTQVANQRAGMNSLLPASFDGCQSIHIARAASDTRAAKQVAKDLKTKAKSTSAKKKLSAGGKTSTARRRVAVRKASVARATSPRKKPGRDKTIGQITVAQPPIPTPADQPVEELLPAISQVLIEPAEQAESLGKDGVVEQVCAAGDEIQNEPGIPAQLFLPVENTSLVEFCVSQELELQAETSKLAESSTPVVQEPVARVEQKEVSTMLSSFWKSLASFLTQAWNWAQQKFKSHQVRKRLRVCETVSLGEKRFVAVIQVDGEQFLVGGSSSSVSTLAHLERSREFSEVFQRHCEQDLSRA